MDNRQILEKQLNAVKKIANLQEYADSFSEVTTEKNIYPFGFTTSMISEMMSYSDDLKDAKVSNPHKTKAGKVFNSVCNGMGYALYGMVTLLCGLIEAPLGIFFSIDCGISSGIGKIRNKRIAKAKVKQAELEKLISELDNSTSIEK